VSTGIVKTTLNDALREACAEVGVVFKVVPDDGQFHRADIDGDRRGHNDASIKLFTDGEGGIVYNWKTGEYRVFFADDDGDLDEAERAIRDRKREDAIGQAEQDKARRRIAAATKAEQIWTAAGPATVEHPYLKRKQVCPVPTLREIDAVAAANILGYQPKSNGELLAGRLLVAPVTIDGKLSTAELIDETGRKSAIAGGPKNAGYWAAQDMPEGNGTGVTLLIGEGVATVLSAKSATGFMSIAALSCTNLKPVAQAMRDRYPAATLIVMADFGNGQAHAEEAAKCCDAGLAVPDFGADRPEDATDFNDLALHRGAETIRTLIAAAIKQHCEWPEPLPVRASLRPVEKLPPALIPEPFRDWLTDISERMGCPLDYAVVAAIVITGSVIGAGLGIRPKREDDWTVVPNTWGGVVGRPSLTLKSPSLQEVTRPLERLASESRTAYESALKVHDADEEMFKAQKEEIRRRMKTVADGKIADAEAKRAAVKKEFTDLSEPALPKWRRYKTNDATVEKLGELLSDNPRGVLVFRDELVGLLSTWDQPGREGDRAFFLECFNGIGSHDTDRIGRGSIHIENACVTILGGIQPARLTHYLYGAMRGHQNDGLVQRFQMLVYPDEPPLIDIVDRRPNADARKRADDIIRKLAEMDFTEYGAIQPEDRGRPYFHFDDAAQEVFYAWFNDLNRRLRTDDESVITEHLGKYKKLMPALALIFHMIDIADDGQRARGPISELTAKRAAAFCEYLESHARRIYALITDVRLEAAARLAKKIQTGELGKEFTVRDVYRRGWELLGDKEIAESACEHLAALGWIREKETVHHLGRPSSTKYLVNLRLKLATRGKADDNSVSSVSTTSPHVKEKDELA
jgi:putative DNA primase/helicase